MGATTMTSLEMVEFINASRGDGAATLRHDHFMVKVPQVLGEDAPKFMGTAFYVLQGVNRARPIYNFPKREAMPHGDVVQLRASGEGL